MFLMKAIIYWIIDTYYFVYSKLLMLIFKNPPKSYLDSSDKSKKPIVLIPGNFNMWAYFKKITNCISKLKHPIYTVKELGWNIRSVRASAEIVREIIDKNNLKNVILLGHSKGGIIGKYMLIHENKDNKISRLIAIATPFLGSDLADHAPIKSFQELSPKNRLIREINLNKKVNHKIISIMPEFDNNVFDNESRLPQAVNIKIPTKGHHRVLFDNKTVEKITELIKTLE
jgi:triacylglycerol lipase